jgi:exopolysaccharide biosynthesis protein
MRRRKNGYYEPKTPRRQAGSAKLVLVMAMFAAGAITFAYTAKARPIVDRNIKVVEVTLGRGVEIRPVLAKGRPGGSEPFSQMVKHLRPLAAINGTYYDDHMKPIGDVVIDGKVVNRGGQHHAIAITKDGRVDFIQRGKGRFKWSGYKWGLAAGPRLVHDGKVALDPVADGFSPASLRITAWRCAVGKTADGKLLLVTATESLTLSQFAKIMKDLGAQEAMNLDGGGACGLYSRGNVLAEPALPMSNILAVFKK